MLGLALVALVGLVVVVAVLGRAGNGFEAPDSGSYGADSWIQ